MIVTSLSFRMPVGEQCSARRCSQCLRQLLRKLQRRLLWNSPSECVLNHIHRQTSCPQHWKVTTSHTEPLNSLRHPLPFPLTLGAHVCLSPQLLQQTLQSDIPSSNADQLHQLLPRTVLDTRLPNGGTQLPVKWYTADDCDT